MMLHLLNLADRAEQIRFLEQMEKEREEEMSKPSIYIFVEGGMVQEVRVTHNLEIAEVVVFDWDNVEDERREFLGKFEPVDEAEKRMYGMTSTDAIEHSKAVWR